jgi:hypothetical protein
MKIVKTGDIVRIFSDDLQTFDKIPVGNYKVGFAPNAGFYLEVMDSFSMNEKPYGKHPQKISKVMSLYENVDRSVGVILSGKKGMGKSMFARLLSVEFSQKHQMPTIVVDEAYKGISEFIESIKQECIILFDEFEKVFDNGEKKEHQDKLLSLFDGISQTKRLYVVTVNEIRKVNQYMINRPGRFHYHIQFKYPSHEEIALYLKDKLKPEFHNQIELVQRFSNRFDLNYDSLRAIAFDLNLGYGFIETMEDLNVSSTENQAVKYDVAIHHSNGAIATTYENIDLMSSHVYISYNTKDYQYGSVSFSPLEVQINNKDLFIVDPNVVDVNVKYDNDNETLTHESGVFVEKIVLTKKQVNNNMKYGKEMSDLI